MVIADLTVQLQPGKVLGLRGRTGSGKTTLTRLLFRLYDLSDGRIRLGGVDIRELRLADLRRRIGVVTQDVQPFRASVRDNLTFFDADADAERDTEVPGTPGPGGGQRAAPGGPVTGVAGFACFRYSRHTRWGLGAISLDLFAMLLGGVTALLPIYAKDVLMTGPWGLGLLRSAPAIGALAVSIWLAHHQIKQRVGHVLFVAVAAIGAAAVEFALSSSLAHSIPALQVLGSGDAVDEANRH